VYWMLGFGIFGYILKMYGFQVGPVILGVILGPLMEDNYRRAMMDQHNNILGFFSQLVVNPLSLALTLGIVITILGQTQFWSWIKRKVWKSKKEGV
ncbi:MAG: hypothetical protein KGZ49_04270, partial [Syntrophaceae bacterium]|nr:hypothetical protein [Syntrophaceae bacterium]